MKSLYIIAFLALSTTIYAQQDKKASEIQEAANYKESKAFEAKMMKEAKDKASEKSSTVTLASERGLEIKQQQAPKQETAQSSGKLITNASNIEDILASIPGRKSRSRTLVSAPADNIPRLLPSPHLTLEDIKKTIPKN